MNYEEYDQSPLLYQRMTEESVFEALCNLCKLIWNRLKALYNEFIELINQGSHIRHPLLNNH